MMDPHLIRLPHQDKYKVQLKSDRFNLPRCIVCDYILIYNQIVEDESILE